MSNSAGPAPNIDVTTATRSTLLGWVKAPERTGEELATALSRYPEVDRAIAGHSNASSSVLSTLSHSSDRSTREKVTLNANTPASDYVRLDQQFPKAFLENPLLYVLMLEDPGIFVALPEALLIRLAKTSNCPASFLEWGSGHESEQVQLAVSVNAGLTPLALERLRGSRFERVRSSLPETSVIDDPESRYLEEVLARLAQMSVAEAKQGWDKKDIGVCQFRHLSMAAQVEIAGLKDSWAMRVALSKNPNLSETALSAYSADMNDAVRAEVAANPRTPESLLAVLAKDLDDEVRSAVACNPRTPEYLLALLANDCEFEVRSAVAANTRRTDATTMASIEAIANATDAWMPKTVSTNPRPLDATTVAWLETRASDRVEDERWAVAENWRTPLHILARLRLDRSRSVSAAAIETFAHRCAAELGSDLILLLNPERPIPLSEASLLRCPSWLTGVVPGASNKDLTKASRDRNWLVRLAVAVHADASAAMLELLSGDPDAEVSSAARRALAQRKTAG